ncbi:MAG: serine protease [Pseudacidovorax sp.]|nr:serine protease [Pseudacidovorax sp.]
MPVLETESRVLRAWRALPVLVLALVAFVAPCSAAPSRQSRPPPAGSADAPASDAQIAALRRALNAVVAVRVSATEGAPTARTLGAERSGSGVVIDEDGLVLTIGYLLLEAETIEITTQDDRRMPARQVAYDQATGFGLLQSLVPLRPRIEPVPMGSVAPLWLGTGGEVKRACSMWYSQ